MQASGNGTRRRILLGVRNPGAALGAGRGRPTHATGRGKSAIVNALVGFSIVLLARVIAGMVQDSIGAP